MKTIKIIHYPEGGNRTTEIFEADKVKIVEGYYHESGLLRDKSPGYLAELRTFGASTNNYQNPAKIWALFLYLDNEDAMICGPNTKLYVMVDGKTVASYESIVIE